MAKQVDPITERNRLRREAERNLHRLAEVARDCFETRKAELKGGGTAGRWFSPLELHILPKLGSVPVAEIDQTDIRDTLKPLWTSKPETGRKALGRLNIVFKHAAALGLDVDVQVVEKARALLGKQNDKAKHIPAMHWQDLPALWSRISEPTPVNLAFKLAILTALRSDAIRHANLDDMDLEAGVWTVPARHLKGRAGQVQDMRIPITPAIRDVIEAATPMARDGQGNRT